MMLMETIFLHGGCVTSNKDSFHVEVKIWKQVASSYFLQVFLFLSFFFSFCQPILSSILVSAVVTTRAKGSLPGCHEAHPSAAGSGPSPPRQGRHSRCHLSLRLHGWSAATTTDSGVQVKGPTCAVLVGRKPLPYYTQQNENLEMDTGFKDSNLGKGVMARFTLTLHFGNVK